MKICVIGGTGGISQYILPEILAAGHELHVFNRGKSMDLPSGALQIVGDRRADRPGFEAAVQRGNYDLVLDFIAYDAADAASTLRACRGVGRLLQVSSCVVYGLDFTNPVTESTPVAPRATLPNDYCRGKWDAERPVLEAMAAGFPATLVRFSATFGGYTGPRRQVTAELAWLDRIPRGMPVLVADHGAARIQCLASADCVRAVLGLATLPQAAGEVYHVAHPEPVSWAEHHRAVMRVLGREVELVSLPLATLAAAAIPRSACLTENFGIDQHFSTAKLQAALPDWRPRISLDTMLESTIATLRDQGAIPDARDPAYAWEDTRIAQARA